MKYIRKFNENTIEESVKEFAQMYLSDIIDRGDVYIGVEKLYNESNYNYKISLSLGTGPDMKTWGSMKDTLLPFFEMFVREYGEISDITVLGRTSLDVDTITYQDILKDNIDDKYLVRGIKFLFNQ